jgi:hypothetical protein
MIGASTNNFCSKPALPTNKSCHISTQMGEGRVLYQRCWFGGQSLSLNPPLQAQHLNEPKIPNLIYFPIGEGRVLYQRCWFGRQSLSLNPPLQAQHLNNSKTQNLICFLITSHLLNDLRQTLRRKTTSFTALSVNRGWHLSSLQ